jgi:hypothetical protein
LHLLQRAPCFAVLDFSETTPKIACNPQGVNSALLDVIALDESLSATAKPTAEGAAAAAAAPGGGQLPEAVDIAAAAQEYHRRQLPQAEALCKLLPVRSAARGRAARSHTRAVCTCARAHLQLTAPPAPAPSP